MLFWREVTPWMAWVRRVNASSGWAANGGDVAAHDNGTEAWGCLVGELERALRRPAGPTGMPRCWSGGRCKRWPGVTSATEGRSPRIAELRPPHARANRGSADVVGGPVVDFLARPGEGRAVSAQGHAARVSKAAQLERRPWLRPRRPPHSANCTKG